MKQQLETELDNLIAAQKANTVFGQLKLFSILRRAKRTLKRDDYIALEDKVMEAIKDRGIVEIPLGVEGFTKLLDEAERGKVTQDVVLLDWLIDELRKRGYSEEQIRRAKGGLTRGVQIELYKVTSIAKEWGKVPKVLTFEICRPSDMRRELEAELSAADKFVKKFKLDEDVKGDLLKAKSAGHMRIIALALAFKAFKAKAETAGVDFSKMSEAEQLRHYFEHEQENLGHEAIVALALTYKAFKTKAETAGIDFSKMPEAEQLRRYFEHEEEK